MNMQTVVVTALARLCDCHEFAEFCRRRLKIFNDILSYGIFRPAKTTKAATASAEGKRKRRLITARALARRKERAREKEEILVDRELRGIERLQKQHGEERERRSGGHEV